MIGVALLQPGKVLAEEFGDFRSGLEAVGRDPGVQAGDDFAKPLGYLRVDLPDGPGRVLADALEDGQRTAGPERRPAGAERVQHTAEAEQVATVIDGAALRLFRRHVQGRADDDATLREAGV